VLALTGAGAALALSEMPVEKTVAAVRIGLVDGSSSSTRASRSASRASSISSSPARTTAS
jgi:polyribonucleotide nucleotidyltransferase